MGNYVCEKLLGAKKGVVTYCIVVFLLQLKQLNSYNKEGGQKTLQEACEQKVKPTDYSSIMVAPTDYNPETASSVSNKS